jgi:hypothetical protein
MLCREKGRDIDGLEASADVETLGNGTRSAEPVYAPFSISPRGIQELQG